MEIGGSSSRVRTSEVAIVGVSETAVMAPGRTALGLNVDAALAALHDAGLDVREVDGIATAGLASKFGATTLAEVLGIQPRWMDTTNIGGASFGLFVAHAMAAISVGMADVVVITYGSVQRSGGTRGLSSAESVDLPLTRHEVPYGPLLPISAYALAAQRYLHETGSTRAQLAEIAVAARAWALRNPAAYRYDAGPLTVDDVLDSAPVSTPLHRLDCCLVTDGGGAIVLTSLDRARDLRRPPVRVLGASALSSHRGISQMPDLTATGAQATSRRAFQGARVRPEDIDVVEVYDSFTITVALTLEALGFCPAGEGARFAADGHLLPGGSRPINTSGGGLSHCHPGMYGIFLLVEAVRQLRREAGERQLVRAETAVCHATGGYLSTHATIVLAIDR
jgi:acetyl-CoA acetyltransferase